MSEEQYKKIFKKNLNNYMAKKGIKQIDLVNKFGLAKSTISSWCTGAKLPRMDKIEALAAFLEISKSDLIEDKAGEDSELIPYNPVVHKIPILGYISAGLPLYAEEHIEGYTYTERNGGAEYFALRVKGDSMSAAKINDGDILIVRKQSTVENGEIAVVRVDSENATVKRFKQDNNIVQLIPQSFNLEHEIQIYDLKNTSIDVIGKVVECKIEF